MAKPSKQGFTLIQLLVVTAIIGLLASIVLVSVNTARRKARDTRRLADMRTVVTALELYYDTYQAYPNSDNEGCGGWDTPGDGDFIGTLTTLGLINGKIMDPTTNIDCGNYFYYKYWAGYAGCDINRGDFYVLGIADMETSGNPHPQSPGWHCPNADWQAIFEWVTGAFEH